METTDIKTTLKELKKSEGLTQAQLAKLLGVKQSTVSKLLSGQQKKINHVAFLNLQKNLADLQK